MIMIRAQGWYYRDRQGALWMDPEQLSDGNWRLYHGGTNPRVFAPDGRCLRAEGKDAMSVGSFDGLVVEIEKLNQEK